MVNSNKWVQHISGQGEKWKLTESSDNLCAAYSVWRVFPKTEGNFHPVLPKSEYVLCESPEIWKDVTGECEVDREGSITHHGFPTVPTSGYRRRKVAVELRSSECYEPVKFAIIIEQKVTG